MTSQRFRELMKPITDGLFGKQVPQHLQERPHWDVRPLGTVMADLAQIGDEEFFRYAFARDPMNGKFNDESRLELTRKAIACGEEYARKMAEAAGGCNAEAVAKYLGADVTCPEMPQSRDRVLFAEFREPDKIQIFMDGIRKGQQQLNEPGVKEALGRFDIAKILLGHELFHMVEEKYKTEIWTTNYRFENFRIGPLAGSAKLTVLSEIAAMAFTKTLNGLKWSPYLMDVFLDYGYDPETACGLYEEMMETTGRTPKPGVPASSAN